MRGRAQQHGRLATASVGVPFPFVFLSLRSPDEAQRNPGAAVKAFAALHPGYK
jgi:hypothetical protein